MTCVKYLMAICKRVSISLSILRVGIQRGNLKVLDAFNDCGRYSFSYACREDDGR